MIVVLFSLFCLTNVSGQNENSDTTIVEEPIRLEDIDISFLSSYYQQDGNNSPVTGGEGTEKLSNIAPSLVIYAPINNKVSVNANLGIDVYSSASSDNINNPNLDPDHVSTASAQDLRYYANLGAEVKSKKLRNKYGIDLGFSNEYDVVSFSGGVSFGRSFAQENQHVKIKLKYFYDDWKLIYPIEFRNGRNEYLETNVRQSISGSVSFSSILHQRVQAEIIADAVYQTGLLSTPFHRVFYKDSPFAGIEQAPSSRFKLPIGLRVNYHVANPLIMRFYYRFYYDSWNILSNTFQLELPIKVLPYLKIYPSYRFYSQSGASFFKAKGEHLTTDTYLSSDFDLSAFISHQVGLGIKIMPENGFFRINAKNSRTYLKDIELKYSYYNRSDGLSAHAVSALFHFSVSRFAKKPKQLESN